MACDKEGWHLIEWTPPCSHIVCSIDDYVISERSVRGHNYGDPRTRCTWQVCECVRAGGGGVQQGYSRSSASAFWLLSRMWWVEILVDEFMAFRAAAADSTLDRPRVRSVCKTCRWKGVAVIHVGAREVHLNLSVKVA